MQNSNSHTLFINAARSKKVSVFSSFQLCQHQILGVRMQHILVIKFSRAGCCRMLYMFKLFSAKIRCHRWQRRQCWFGIHFCFYSVKMAKARPQCCLVVFTAYRRHSTMMRAMVPSLSFKNKQIVAFDLSRGVNQLNQSDLESICSGDFSGHRPRALK